MFFHIQFTFPFIQSCTNWNSDTVESIIENGIFFINNIIFENII